MIYIDTNIYLVDGIYMDNNTVLNDLKKNLKSNLGGIVDLIILFGSRASGGAQEYSDYDILIILNTDYDWRKEREIYEICYETDLKYNIITDIKVISLSELLSLRGKQPYIQNALEMGISA